MRQLRRMFKAIAGLFRKKAAEQDLDREICAFVEQLIHENVQAGMSPAHARRAALLEIEGEQQLKEKVRNAWAGAWLDRLMLDIHFGTRLLRRNKGFAGAAILMLAIGIGSNTAIFSLLYGVLLKPMPYPEPDRVASIWHTWTAGGFNKLGINAGHVAALRERTRFFDSAGVYQVSSSLISPNEQAERVRTAYATAGVLESFGVTPILGRGFRREDEGQGAPVAILSYALWQRWFHGDPAIFGKSVRIDQRAATVVGVLPADFRLPEDLTGDEATQIWEPLAVNPSADGYQFTAVARLKHGSSLQQAKGELDVLFHGQAEQPNTREDDLRLHVTSIRDDVVSDVKPALWALSSAVAVVLLIVCANTSSLMLTRAMARRKEIALRVALGAEPGRIVRQLLTESMMISLLGGALGIGLAAAALKTIATLAARDVPRLGQATLNLPVLTFTVAISILSALLFGLLPAIHSTRPQLNKALQSEGKAMSANSAKSLWQRLLVIAEVAASMVLVVGAGLLLRSFQRLTHVDPGFHVQKILTAAIELPHFSYPDGPRANLFCRSLLDRVRAMPGVISAGFTTSPPLTGIGGDSGFDMEGQADHTSSGPLLVWQITPGYLETMGIGVIRGRAFLPTDETATPTMLISESAARVYWPGKDPIGKHIRLRWSYEKPPGEWAEIIGIVHNVATELGKEPQPESYMLLPHADRLFVGRMSTYLAVRSSTKTDALSGLIREQIRLLDRQVTITRVRTAGELVADTVSQPRFNLILLAAFAGIALILAALGIYGVLADIVRQRTMEIGIRIALGAQSTDIFRMIVARGMLLVSVGIAFGLAGAVAASRLLRNLLYSVKPTDPFTYLAVTAAFCTVAFLACFLPARRAMAVDPMNTLNCQ